VNTKDHSPCTPGTAENGDCLSALSVTASDPLPSDEAALRPFGYTLPATLAIVWPPDVVLGICGVAFPINYFRTGTWTVISVSVSLPLIFVIFSSYLNLTERTAKAWTSIPCSVTSHCIYAANSLRREPVGLVFARVSLDLGLRALWPRTTSLLPAPPSSEKPLGIMPSTLQLDGIYYFMFSGITSTEWVLLEWFPRFGGRKVV